MLARSIAVEHTTIYRWLQERTPELDNQIRPHLKPTHDLWEVDETNVAMTVKYLNYLIDQDDRFIKHRVKPGLGSASFNMARQTLKGYEAMNIIRKGQIQHVLKGDAMDERDLPHDIFGIAA